MDICLFVLQIIREGYIVEFSLLPHKNCFASRLLRESEGPFVSSIPSGGSRSHDPDTVLPVLLGILFSRISGQEGFGKIQDDHQFKEVKQESPVLKVLYGKHLYGKKNSSASGSLYGLCRSSGCLSPRAHISIYQSHQKYLKLVIHSKFWVLPFVLSAAPRVFTKILSEAMAFFCLQGILVVAYLDDFLIFSQTREKLALDLGLMMRTLRFLGWLINFGKSNLVPSQSVEFLGYKIHFTRIWNKYAEISLYPNHKWIFKREVRILGELG